MKFRPEKVRPMNARMGNELGDKMRFILDEVGMTTDHERVEAMVIATCVLAALCGLQTEGVVSAVERLMPMAVDAAGALRAKAAGALQ